ncbi:MAG: NADPH:quinone oxidoreductase family protein, partial [Polyangiales bacterium]
RVVATVAVGGFADEIVTGWINCTVIPNEMDYVTAAGFSMTYGTSYYALVQRANLQAGEVLLVHGASGGVGSAALDIGRNLGARLIATGGNDDKLARVAQQYGVEHVINYRTTPNWKDKVKELTLAQGADVIYDAVGNDVLESSIRCAAWNGRVLVIGFAGGEIPKIPANLVLLKNASLVGVFWGAWVVREREQNRSNFATMFEWYAAGKLKPIVSHTFPLAKTADALHALTQRQVVGKCVITTGRSPAPQGNP